MAQKAHEVVIVGGGFGGLKLAMSLKRAPVHVTLLDRRNFHVFQPLLYQVATGTLSPAHIATPLRSLLRRQANVEVFLDEVLDFDTANRHVICREGAYRYDTLVVATGVHHQYFGHDTWEANAAGLKSLEDATGIRGRILSAFETAERIDSPDERKPWMTFVIVGAGPTGVELAGAIGDLVQRTLNKDFRRISTLETRIFLLEGSEHILATFPKSLAVKAEQSLARLDVTVRAGARVTEVRSDGVTFQCGDTNETIAAHTILWAAGVKASPLGGALSNATGAELDRVGRVKVQGDLSLPDHPEIFVIGDLANVEMSPGKTVPGVAQPAIQEGTYVARLIQARMQGSSLSPFKYKDRGNMATIGRHAAIADLGWLRLSGRLGRLMWAFVHLLFIEQRHNRLLILMEWVRNYFTGSRSARLITGVSKDTPSHLMPPALSSVSPAQHSINPPSTSSSSAERTSSAS